MGGLHESACLGSSLASEAQQRPRWQRGLWIAARVAGGIVLLLAIGQYLLTGLDAVPYHVDEDAYLSGSYLYHLFARERRWSSWYWQRARVHEAPPVGRYVIGLGLELAGEPVESSPYKFDTWWDSQRSLPKQCERFAPSTLAAGRRIATIASVGACAALFAAAWRALGWLTAMASVALMGWNPLVALSGRRAMSDGPLLFFWLLAVLLPTAFFDVLIGRAAARRPCLQAALVCSLRCSKGQWLA